MAGFNVKIPSAGGSRDDDGPKDEEASLSIPKQPPGSDEAGNTTTNASSIDEKASPGTSNATGKGSSGSAATAGKPGGSPVRLRGISIPGRSGESGPAENGGNAGVGGTAGSDISSGEDGRSDAVAAEGSGAGGGEGAGKSGVSKPAEAPKMPVLIRPGALGTKPDAPSHGDAKGVVDGPSGGGRDAKGDDLAGEARAGSASAAVEDEALANGVAIGEPPLKASVVVKNGHDVAAVDEPLVLDELLVDSFDEDFFPGEDAGVEDDYPAHEAPVNPLLADDGESETYAAAGGDLLRDVDEGSFNPLLDDEEEEDLVAFTGRVRGPAPVQVVPERPDRDSVQEANRAKKLAAEEEERLRREAARVGRATTENDAIDFKRRAVAEVSADDVAASGRAARAAREAEKAGEDGSEGAVKTPRGADRWAVKAVDGAPDGKLGREELSLFANLSLANSDDDARDELRAIFARVDEKHDDQEAREKRRELAKRAVLGDEAMARGTRKQFTEKDRDVLRFLAKFKYANAKHVSRTLQVSEKTMEKRLHSLRKRGLMVQKALYGAKPLWYLTEAGMICSGLDLPRTKESGITYGMLPHGFVVNHVAGNLWAGGINVLNLEDYPVRNRIREKGELAMGEELVSELEIQSSFSQIRIGSSKESYRPLISESRDRLFKEWKKAGGPDFGPSPEQVPGNEFMWTLIPPFNLNLAYHVPDLVVKRPRRADGSPDSIAVEIELANKPYALYERALYAYKYDSLIYGQVIWVVKSRGAARKLEQAADKLGLLDDGRIDIVPIYTEEGIFTGKAEWTI